MLFGAVMEGSQLSGKAILMSLQMYGDGFTQILYFAIATQARSVGDDDVYCSDNGQNNITLSYSHYSGQGSRADAQNSSLMQWLLAATSD